MARAMLANDFSHLPRRLPGVPRVDLEFFRVDDFRLLPRRPRHIYPPKGPKGLPSVGHLEIQKLMNDDFALKEACFHKSGCFAPALKAKVFVRLCR